MTNVNTAAEELHPQAGSDNKGRKTGLLVGIAKAAQNDTITVTNARSIDYVDFVIDATGVKEPATISGNVLTFTSVTTGTVTGTVIYRN